MKLFSTALESIAIRSICNSNEKLSALLLGSLDESFFHYEPCKAAFQRIYNVAKKRSVILDYTELLEDPGLNEEYRDLLKDSDAKTLRSIKGAKRVLAKLGEYRKTRSMYSIAKHIIEKLKAPEVEVEELLNFVTNALTSARTKEDVSQLVYSLGKNGNGLELIDLALSVEDEVLLKTGYAEIDNKNGGIPSEGVMLLASTTSGGKSTMLMNLLMNIYRLNKVSCSNVSLEMNERKLTRRMVSRMTQIPYWKFTKQRLSEEERVQAKKAWRRFHRFGERNDCQFSIICPTHSVSITSLLTLLKPYGHKVIGIDYISLLEGVDAQDQWRVLSAITREAKIFSAENHCLVILLAQLDSDDDRIRYAKGILEHVDAAWTWNYYKPEVRETKTLPIRQLKARDQELYPFELRESFETMTIDNMEGATEAATDDGGAKEASKKDDVDLAGEVEVGYDTGQQ